jgi:hypothetical protein
MHYCGTTGNSPVSNKGSTVIVMRERSQFALLFLLFLSPLGRGQDVLLAKSPAGWQPLEIKLAKPPSWRDHCLEIAIKRVNHSKSRISLASTPFEGVEIYSSLTQAKSTLELDGREIWILVYGWSDVIYSEGRTLAPGSEEQNTYCIGETFPVKDMVTNATRQVRLQGRLRILASYEQKVPKRKINRQQQADMTRTTPAREGDSGSWSSGQAALEIQIPCPAGVVNADCLSPPPVFSGEHDQWTTLPKAPVL